MKNLTYEAYVSNPGIREQLEREVRQMRAETVQACFRALFRAVFRGTSRRTPVLKLKTA